MSHPITKSRPDRLEAHSREVQVDKAAQALDAAAVEELYAERRLVRLGHIVYDSLISCRR